MSPVAKLSPALGLVIASAIIVNSGYMATNLYGIPQVISVIFMPCALVVFSGWITRSMRKTIVLSLSTIALAAIMTQISLASPVILGIIEGMYYQNMFIYAVFIRVIRYVLVSTFFALITALAAGLAFE